MYHVFVMEHAGEQNRSEHEEHIIMRSGTIKGLSKMIIFICLRIEITSIMIRTIYFSWPSMPADVLQVDFTFH